MAKTIRDTLRERMNDPEFRAEWEALEPERQIMLGILKGCQVNDFTQEQLAEATGITQEKINRIENDDDGLVPKDGAEARDDKTGICRLDMERSRAA